MQTESKVLRIFPPATILPDEHSAAPEHLRLLSEKLAYRPWPVYLHGDRAACRAAAASIFHQWDDATFWREVPRGWTNKVAWIDVAALPEQPLEEDVLAHLRECSFTVFDGIDQLPSEHETIVGQLLRWSAGCRVFLGTVTPDELDEILGLPHAGMICWTAVEVSRTSQEDA